MKPVFTSLLVSTVLAATTFAVSAQPMGMNDQRHPMMDGAGPMGHPMQSRGPMDPAKVDAWMAKRAAELKTKLKITAAQEPAWTTFTTAMKPPARLQNQRPDPAEMAKLTTPERIDKMHSLRAQHLADMSAAMDKRDEAVKAFYAVLSPEQQKVFDAEHARLAEHRAHRGGPGAPAAADKAKK